MSIQDIANTILRLLAILLSWPVILLVLIVLVRHELPTLLRTLSERITKAPGGFEFGELRKQVNDLDGKVEKTAEKVDKTAERLDVIESSLYPFISYFRELGFLPAKNEVRISIDSETTDASYYDASQRQLVIGKDLAGTAGPALREYTNYALFSAVGADISDLSDVCIEFESGLAYYFPSSFADDAALVPYITSLENVEMFHEIPTTWTYSSELQGEVWGAAFWELRKLLGQVQTDRLLFSTWSGLTPSDLLTRERVDFAKRLLEAAPSYGGENYITQIQAIFERRGLRF